MSLASAIKTWDGRSSGDIAAIYVRYVRDETFSRDILALAAETRAQRGATWLLKHHLEQGQDLSAAETRELVRLLPDLGHWEARLHVLQSLPRLRIGREAKADVEAFLRDCLAGENKFVRAWAYNGFYELSIEYPEYAAEAASLLDMATRDEAPSVKARVRSILKGHR